MTHPGQPKERIRLVALLALVVGISLALFYNTQLHFLPVGGLSAIDGELNRFLYMFRGEPFTSFFLFFTVLGSTTFVSYIGGIAFLYFLWRMRTYVLPFAAAVLGEAYTVALLKDVIHRGRPAVDFAFYPETLFSFPSGHSAIAIAAYGFIAYAFWKTAQGKMQKTAIVMLAVLVALLIGMSRLYLGVHYLSDVLGGFLFGGLWLLIGITLHRLIQHR